MIVVDTNVIAYLFIVGDKTSDAKNVFLKDSDWISPMLWRSEFRNILALYLHQKYMTLEQAIQLTQEAELLMRGKELEVFSSEVLELAANSNCSAYDCEFVSIAKRMGVALVTSDKKILSEFPQIAVSMEEFISKH